MQFYMEESEIPQSQIEAGSYITDLQICANLTQEECAEKLGVTVGTLQIAEQGLLNVSLKTLVQIKQILKN